MKTPICDYVNQFCRTDALRLHMPGHKGAGPLGVEMLDITEIPGADSLYEAAGIIRESEENASRLFGCPTFYSTEGASQCIRAMVLLAMLSAKEQGRTPCIAAGRNAHKAFLNAAALLDADVVWLQGKAQENYLSCTLTAADLELAFSGDEKPTAVYITSPDYLGNVADIEALACVCHRHGALLLVDNAHGAYLRFLPQSLHPMDLGADLCCSSAHKTLPVLTGGAYLHTRRTDGVKEALELFGSTSPSYLILQSLDACNVYLAEFPEKLRSFVPKVAALREKLRQNGYRFMGNEPMKLTLCTKPYGYLGVELAARLAEKGIVCEFADPDFVVLMPTPQTEEAGLARLEQALLSIPERPAIQEEAPRFHDCEQVCTIRQAMLSPGRRVAVEEALGGVLASPCVGCPPAVPIVMCGQRINEHAVAAFRYYGITHCNVME